MSTIPTNWTDSIGMSVNASYLNNLGTEVNATIAAKSGYGTYASMPSASSYTGQVYYCSDIDSVYRSNGTTWDLLSVAGRSCSTGLAEPKSSGLSNTTLGSATFTASKGSRVLYTPSNSGSDALRAEYWSLSPTSNYTATFYLEFRVPVGNYTRHGIFLRESSSGKYVMLEVYGQTNFYVAGERWTNSTSPSASFSGQWNLNGASGSTHGSDGSWPNWFRFRDDNTNRYLEISFNGQEWITILSEGRTTFITPDQIGWGGSVNNGSITSYLRLRSFTIV